VSKDDIGRSVAQVHPSLGRLGQDLRIEDLSPVDAARGADLVFLGLPHAVSMAVMPDLVRSGVKVIDLSGDFRLQDPAQYEKYYGEPHIASDLLPSFVYGLPELFREEIAQAHFVASPGCFATSQILAMAPLARRGWLRGEAKVVSVTGSSGSGARPGLGTHHPIRSVNLKAYKPLRHQHTPEVVQALARVGAPDLSLAFVPVSAPISRGILTTALVDLPPGVDSAQVQEAYEEFTRDEPFLRLCQDRLPEVAAVKGSQYVEVGAVVDGARVAAFCALDNLVKGGAGQAIQSFNLMMNRNETHGLDALPSWP
jgi:N-acetyl-gamma-glutamyl-phosphate reductase